MTQSPGKTYRQNSCQPLHTARAGQLSEQTRLLDVVIISTSNTWGPAEEQVRLMSTGMRDRGHSVRLVAHGDSPLAERFNARGFEVEVIQGWDRGPAALWRMRRYLKQTSPEVVHFTDARALTCGGMAVLGLRIPVRVYSYRDGSLSCSPVTARMFSDVIVCESQAGVDRLVKLGVPWPDVHLIRDAVELNRSVLSRWSTTRSARSFGPAPHLLMIAPLCDRASWPTLLDALSVIRRRYADVGIRVLTGEEEVDRLMKTAADAGHARRVEVYNEKHGLADLLPQSELAVVPGRILRRWNAVAEVMLSGTPIASVPDDLNAEWLGPRALSEPVAWFSETVAAESLGRAVLQALADPDECYRRAANGCRRVLSDFSGDRLVSEVLQLYLQQLANLSQATRAA